MMYPRALIDRERSRALAALLVMLFTIPLPLWADQPADNSWRQFPLMMINIQTADLPEVAPLVDVVSYYTSFAPFDAPGNLGQAEADELSFRFDLRAQPLMAAAADAGLHVTVTPAILASKSALGGDPLFAGSGVVAEGALWVDPDVVPGCVDPETDAACIQVPFDYNQITPEYIDYWAGKLPNFFQAVADADPGGVVWGVYGLEEIRRWQIEREYGAQRRLRLAMDASPLSQLPLVAYSPHNRMPESLAWTLLAVPGVDDAFGSLTSVHLPNNPRSFLPSWSDPEANCQGIGPGCDVLAFDDYYPLQQEFATGMQGGLLPMQTHLMRGSYLGALLGANGHTNRVASLHRMDAQLETLDHVRETYTANGQHPPKHLAFHLPDLNLCTLAEAQTTAAEARHDFWSGVHRGQGIFLYNYNFVVQAKNGVFNTACDNPPTPEQVLTVWHEYEQGLRLIKNTLRPYLVGGQRTEPVAFSSLAASELELIPGTDYLIDHPIPGANATSAMPDYPALNGSMHRIGPVAYLVVTSSWNQDVRFGVSFDDPICSLSVAHGEGGSPAFFGDQLFDSMSGIDGRVYRVVLAENGEPCP